MLSYICLPPAHLIGLTFSSCNPSSAALSLSFPLIPSPVANGPSLLSGTSNILFHHRVRSYIIYYRFHPSCHLREFSAVISFCLPLSHVLAPFLHYSQHSFFLLSMLFLEFLIVSPSFSSLVVPPFLPCIRIPAEIQFTFLFYLHYGVCRLLLLTYLYAISPHYSVHISHIFLSIRSLLCTSPDFSSFNSSVAHSFLFLAHVIITSYAQPFLFSLPN